MATGGDPLGLNGTVDITEDRGPSVTTAAIAQIALSTLFVAARFASRKVGKVRILSSDYILLVGYVFTVCFTAIEIVAVQHGLGKHIIVNPIAEDILLLKLLYSEALLYTVGLTATKISILLMYRTIFPTSPTRTFRIIAYAVGVLCILWGTSTMLVAIFSCTPIHDYWDILKTLTGQTNCINQKHWYLATSVVSVISDGFILALPLISIWNLHLSWKAKFSISALFLLGGFVLVAAIIRLVVLDGLDNEDITWSYVSVAIWTMIEINVGIISASLPTLRPLLLAVAPLLSRLGMSIRSFVPRNSKGGYDMTSSKNGSVRACRQTGAQGRADAPFAETLQGYPYCTTEVQSEPTLREGMRAARKRGSDEEMAELYALERPAGEGGIVVQKDVVQTWDRNEQWERRTETW